MSGVEGASSNCVDDGDSDTNEVDYQDYRPHVPGFKRYPLHDCCEFGNAESLRVSGNIVVLFSFDSICILG